MLPCELIAPPVYLLCRPGAPPLGEGNRRATQRYRLALSQLRKTFDLRTFECSNIYIYPRHTIYALSLFVLIIRVVCRSNVHVRHPMRMADRRSSHGPLSAPELCIRPQNRQQALSTSTPGDRSPITNNHCQHWWTTVSPLLLSCP